MEHALIFRKGASHTLSPCQRSLSRTGSPVQRHGSFGPVGTIFDGNSPIGMTVEQFLSLQDRHLIQRSPAVQQSPFLEAAIVPARRLTRHLPSIKGGETPFSYPVVVRYSIRRLSRCPRRTLCMSSLRYPMRRAKKNFCGSSCRPLSKNIAQRIPPSRRIQPAAKGGCLPLNARSRGQCLHRWSRSGPGGCGMVSLWVGPLFRRPLLRS